MDTTKINSAFQDSVPKLAAAADVCVKVPCSFEFGKKQAIHCLSVRMEMLMAQDTHLSQVSVR